MQNKLYWFLSNQLGLNIQRIAYSLRGLPHFISDLRKFRKNFSSALTLMPCLHDWHEEGGTTASEYFWQDLIVARRIFEDMPKRHADIGSRVDGFVAHVATFRNIEVFDVRSVSRQIPRVVFKQIDLMNQDDLNALLEQYDSLSCLHALEHFGLGRYGDPIDPNGHEKGLANMAALLKSGGVFYLSVPIGRERVFFNAHRVFDPRTILGLAELNGLLLYSLLLVNENGQISEKNLDDMDDEVLHNLASLPYQLGIFIFTKKQ